MSLPTRRPLRGCFYRNRTLAGRPARSGNLIPPRLLPQHLKRKGRLLPHNTAFSGRFGRPGRPAPPRRWCPRVDGGCSKPRCVPPAARTRVALPRPHSPCSTGCPSSDRTTRARRRHIRRIARGGRKEEEWSLVHTATAVPAGRPEDEDALIRARSSSQAPGQIVVCCDAAIKPDRVRRHTSMFFRARYYSR